jgi:translation initiation factor IF-1
MTESGSRMAVPLANDKMSIKLAPHDFSRAQIVFRAKQPGRMEKF